MLVINFWGAPGSGKSTCAALTYGLLKQHGVRAELVREFAQELIWERHTHVFAQMGVVFREQHRRLERLVGTGVAAVVSDSPLPLPAFYDRWGVSQGRWRLDDPTLEDRIWAAHHRYDNLDFFLHPDPSLVDAIGRIHRADEVEDLGRSMAVWARAHAVTLIPLDRVADAPVQAVALAQRRLGGGH